MVEMIVVIKKQILFIGEEREDILTFNTRLIDDTAMGRKDQLSIFQVINKESIK